MMTSSICRNRESESQCQVPTCVAIKSKDQLTVRFHQDRKVKTNSCREDFSLWLESFHNKHKKVELIPLPEPATRGGGAGILWLHFQRAVTSIHHYEQLPSPDLSTPSCRLQGIGGGAPRSLMDQFAEVLFSLNKHCYSLLGVWLKEALQPPGFPSSRVTTEQKDNFSQQILR